MRAETQEPLTLVGAGLVGSLLATFLARRGYRSRLYERRPDMRKHSPEHAAAQGRSINHAIPMRGRMMHAVDGELTFQPYGRDDSECINSVSRAELNKLLMTSAEATG